MDADSAIWVQDLTPDGPVREQAVNRLHQLLLRVARAEAARRRDRLPDRAQGELDDLTTQAASDAVMAISRKLDSFQGASRFTTWASKFVMLEFSSAVRRSAWLFPPAR